MYSCYEGNEALDINDEESIDFNLLPCTDFICDDNTALTIDHPAFLAFGSNVTITENGDEFDIITNGKPSHTSPYWDTTNVLYAVPTANMTNQTLLNPNQYKIDDITENFKLTVPSCPSLNDSTRTYKGFGPIGIAVSGALIFSDSINLLETSALIRPFIDIDGGRPLNGLGYHYFFEPRHITNNNENLVGIMADGFFLYGRNHNITGYGGLGYDCTNGHIHPTAHSNGENVYHYHIRSTNAVNGFFPIFRSNFGGTPSEITTF